MAFSFSKEHNKSDYEILKSNFDKLKFIKGIAIYYDITASQRRSRTDRLPSEEHNYAIVKENGEFLFDKSYFDHSRFYHAVKINEFGLLVLDEIHNYGYKKQRPAHYYTVIDYFGNFVGGDDFDKTILILKNRELSIEEENDRFELPHIMKQGRFDTTCFEGIQHGGWGEKEGDFFYVMEQRDRMD